MITTSILIIAAILVAIDLHLECSKKTKTPTLREFIDNDFPEFNNN